MVALPTMCLKIFNRDDSNNIYYFYCGAWVDQRVLPWYNYNTTQWLVVIPWLVVIGVNLSEPHTYVENGAMVSA